MGLVRVFWGSPGCGCRLPADGVPVSDRVPWVRCLLRPVRAIRKRGQPTRWPAGFPHPGLVERDCTLTGKRTATDCPGELYCNFQVVVVQLGDRG